MKEPSDRHRWADVDDRGDTEYFVDYLDAMTGHEAIQAYKRQTYTLMDIQEGSQVLDVGCGTGDDVQVIARMVGSGGRVVGIDNSEAMVAEAQQRSEGQGLPLESYVGDAHELDFPAETFDSCRADRVFEHLPDRERALAEMLRVTRPGGKIVVAEPDWDTLLIDTPDRTLTRKTVHHISDCLRHGWCGRQMPRLFREAGLLDVIVVPGTVIYTSLAFADHAVGLRKALDELQEAGEVSAAEGDAWLAHLETADEAGLFFCAQSGFLVGGRKA
jgi:ubiquinone/menaquinone biosynthesis C-methylase UbiE